MKSLKNIFLGRKPALVRKLRIASVLIFVLYCLTGLVMLSINQFGHNYQVVTAVPETATIASPPMTYDGDAYMPVTLSSGHLISLRAVEPPLPVGTEVTVWSAALTEDQVSNYDSNSDVSYPSSESRAYSLAKFNGLTGSAPVSDFAIEVLVFSTPLWSLLAVMLVGIAKIISLTEEMPLKPGKGVPLKYLQDLFEVVAKPVWPLLLLPCLFAATSAVIIYLGMERAGLSASSFDANFFLFVMIMFILSALVFLVLGYGAYKLSKLLSYLLIWGKVSDMPGAQMWEYQDSSWSAQWLLKVSRIDVDTMNMLAENSAGTFGELIKSAKLLGPSKA